MSDLREAVARVIDDGVRQALRDYDISDETMRGDPELWGAALLEADAALAAIEAAGFVVKRRDAIEESEATLEAYVSDFCEGFCAECDLDYAASVMLNDCSGCRARVALAKAAKP